LSQTETHDWLPKEITKNQKLPSLSWALNEIHFPTDEKKLSWALKKLKFDEIFLLQLKSLFLRGEFDKKRSPAIALQLKSIQNLVRSLPYKLTDSQRKIAWKILEDMSKNKPMHRLLEGEVGSGKTIIAIIAALNVAQNGLQTAYLAPTEILAIQQFNVIKNLLAKKNKRVNVALLTGNYALLNDKKSTKQKILANLSAGKIQIAVGTHALLSDKMKFASLGLLIVDEQHRFGVLQRQLLLRQKISPHFLSLTATPIPRSLALTVFGDLDLSVLKDKPANRQETITKIVGQKNRQKLYDFIAGEMKNKNKVLSFVP
jgi:ATP-dependent DNA helicase RecG